MFKRFASCRQPFDAGFTVWRTAGLQSSDRIAGYISSWILEVAGEALVPALRYIGVPGAGQ